MKLLYYMMSVTLMVSGCAVEHVMVHAMPSYQAFIEGDKHISVNPQPKASCVWQAASDKIRVPYHPFYQNTGCMAVEGVISKSTIPYPIVLDTGSAGAVLVNDIHVRHHQLQISPLKLPEKGNPTGLGLCQLEGVQIATMLLETPACWYAPVHKETQLYGITLARDNAIILGLPALKTLSYVLFDNIAHEAELSQSRRFEPEHPDQWSTYPLTVKTNIEGFLFLVVSLPLAGQSLEMQFDTGSGRGLSMTNKRWQQLVPTVQTSTLEEASDFYPYIGRLPCKHGFIEQFRLGNNIIDRSSVSVYAANNPLLRDCDTLIGMQCFKGRILVVDFYQNKLWIKSDSV